MCSELKYILLIEPERWQYDAVLYCVLIQLRHCGAAVACEQLSAAEKLFFTVNRLLLWRLWKGDRISQFPTEQYSVMTQNAQVRKVFFQTGMQRPLYVVGARDWVCDSLPAKHMRGPVGAGGRLATLITATGIEVQTRACEAVSR